MDDNEPSEDKAEESVGPDGRLDQEREERSDETDHEPEVDEPTALLDRVGILGEEFGHPRDSNELALFSTVGGTPTFERNVMDAPEVDALTTSRRRDELRSRRHSASGRREGGHRRRDRATDHDATGHRVPLLHE